VRWVGVVDNHRSQINIEEITMGDKGSRDKGKKEQQKKALLTPKEKRAKNKAKKNSK